MREANKNSAQKTKLLLSEKNWPQNNDQSARQSEANAIFELVQLLQSVDTESDEAKLNATSISDGKGGRILL